MELGMVVLVPDLPLLISVSSLSHRYKIQGTYKIQVQATSTLNWLHVQEDVLFVFIIELCILPESTNDVDCQPPQRAVV